MTADEFSDALAKALELCRAAAAQDLPIAEMLEFVEDAIDADGAVRLEFRLEASLEALRVIIAAVGDVAAIGTKLPPVAAHNPDAPLPANLRGA